MVLHLMIAKKYISSNYIFEMIKTLQIIGLITLLIGSYCINIEPY